MSRVQIGDKVHWAGHVWMVDAIDAYDHQDGRAPRLLTLRRTIVVDPKRRFRDEAIFKRNVNTKDVAPLENEALT